MKYISTSDVKIDHDILLHYATLMSDNRNAKKRTPALPPPPKFRKLKSNQSNPKPSAKTKPSVSTLGKPKKPRLDPVGARDAESIIRGLADTAALFEKFGCASGEYWGVVFSNTDGGRIGVAYVGDQLPDIFFLRDEAGGNTANEQPSPPRKRLRVSSRASA